MKRVLLFALATVVIALAGGFYVLAYTQTGIELLVAQLNRLERLGIHAEGVSGRVTGPLRIARFELDHERVHVVVEDIVIDLKLRWLALQTIDVDALTARTATVELKTAADEPPPENPPRFLPGFLRVSVARATVDEVRLTTANGQQIVADSVRTAARLRSDRLWLDDLEVLSPQFTVQGDLELLAARPFGLKFAGSGILPDGERPDLETNITLDGTVEDFAIAAELTAPSAAQVKGRFIRMDESWQLQGQVTAAMFAFNPWLERPPFSLTDVALDFNARPEVVRVTGRLAAPELDPKGFTLDATGRYLDRTLIISAANLAQIAGPARLRMEGRVAFDGGPPALNVASEWTNLRWPLTAATPAAAIVESAAGRLTLSGPLPYRYSVSAAVSGPSIPTARGLVNGVLSRDDLRVERYDIQTLEGSLTGTATLAFNAPRRWTFTTTAMGLNPVSLHEEFPGELDLVASGTGTGLDANASFDVDVTRLRGRLRGLPVNGNGRFDRTAERWRARDVALSMGEARLTLAGELGETLDLNWTFDAPDLAVLFPESGGALTFSGSADGPRTRPHVLAHLDGRSLRYADWTIGTATLDADVDLAGSAASRLVGNLSNVRNGTLRAENVRLAGQGNAEAHSLELAVTAGTGGDPTTAELDVTGRLVAGVWTAEIASGRIASSERDGLRLAEPATVIAARDHAEVQRLCLFLLTSEVCGNGNWRRGGDWQVDVTGDDIPLDVIRLVFPDQPRYLGSMDLTVLANGSAGTPWQGNASLLLTDGGIVYQLSRDAADATETVQFGSGRADVQATAETFNLAIGLAATAETFIAATASAARLPGATFGELPLTGRLRARMGDANLLPLLVAEIDDAAGVLTADAALSGSLNAPRLDGRLDLADGALDMYRVNLSLRDMQVTLNLIANRLDFAGQGKAGDGSWNLGGTLQWRQGLPVGTLALKGENLLVADLPEYRVVASPDLNFLVEGRRIDAAGEVFIPSARIQPTDLSGAVQVSPDARLTQTPATENSTFVVNSEIRIRLGDDVQLDTFGLAGQLGGSVGTTMRTGDIAIGRGELTVANGRYEAYGQNLGITRGRLLFDASPLDDPGLDIQAERMIETTRVGLNVRGTLRDPRFGFYSEPAMSQTQILSYLLVGKPIDDLQNRDTAAVGSARDTLALQGGGILAAQLGRRLGLGEIGVESNGANDTSLVLGRFLSPRLFVSYGISLTESINTLKLRYTISDRWVLKTEAGQNQSADVEFTIEKP